MAPKFDWNQYSPEDSPMPQPQPSGAPQAQPKKFDWNQFDAENEVKPATTTATKSAADHFANAATLGYLPQIQATLQIPFTKIMDKVTGSNASAGLPKYVQLRDETIKDLQTESSEHPYASLGGSLAGAVATAAPMNAIAPINAATRAGRILQAARSGAILGAVSNPGDKEGEVDVTQLGDRGINAIKGAGMSAAGQGVIEGVSAAAKGITSLPSTLTDKAEERAFKSSGAMLRDYRKAAGQERINELGRYMLDNGLVKPGMTVDDVAQMAAQLQQGKGEAIGKVLDELGAHEAANGGAQVLRSGIAEDVKNRLIQEGNIPSVAKNNSYFSDLADELGKLGGDKMSVGDLQKLKTVAGKNINWDRLPGADIPLEEQFNRAVYGAAKDALETRADELAQAAGKAQNYTQLKSDFRNASDIAKIAKDQALRQNANRFLSPSDYASGLGGAMIGAATGEDLEHKVKNAAAGLSLGLANKAARTYGTALVSQGLDKAGSLLARTPLQATGEVLSPILNAAERAPTSTAGTIAGLAESNLGNSSRFMPPRSVASDEPRGEAKWVQTGLDKLNLEDPVMIRRVLQSPKGRQLLIQASDLSPESPAFKNIMGQIRKGYGNKK